MKGICISIRVIVFLGLVYLTGIPVPSALANTFPPTPTNHFYGDADGDTLITGIDVNQANAYILSKPYSVPLDTLQALALPNPMDEWNTLDVDNDRLLTGNDVNQMNAFILSRPVTLGALPWILENDDGAVWGLPTTGNPSGVPIPFQINLYSTHPSPIVGLSGRAGLSVIAQINPASHGTGSLSGRECVPNSGPVGPRDQANLTDDQCAIAVTITDWDGLGNDLGLTESGAFGFAVTGNGGDLIIDFRIEARPAFDIPAVTLTLNVSFACDPTLAGTYDTPDAAVGVYVSGSYAYVADLLSLQIIDVSNPASPSLAGTYDTPDYAADVYVSGSDAYVANGEFGLLIIDVFNPASPTLAGTYDTPDFASGVYVSGNYAYVADYPFGLQIIDVSNTFFPALAGAYYTPGEAVDVYVSGNYAYVADSSSGLQIIDVSNPASPSLAGTYDTPDFAYDVYVSGSYAYVADRASGLQIIDVSNPALPTLVGTYDTPDWAVGIYVSGSYAYVADYDSGLLIIDVSDPASPTLAGTYDTPGEAYGVYVVGNYAYVADTNSGLQIFQVVCP